MSPQLPEEPFKILFYHAVGYKSWLYPTILQLKTHIDLFYPDTAKRLEWLLPIQHRVSNQELIKQIEKTKADVLCTSHYIWNHSDYAKQLSEIRNKLRPGIKVIAGGPSIDVNINKDFFKQHSYIDYAVYAAGEQAFVDIINHLINKTPLIASGTSNCAWRDDITGKTVVANYKFVKMMQTSPYIQNKELFVAMTEEAKEEASVPVWIPYVLTRGCPYACTFCDWNSGLGNKVSRRKGTYKQDIDLFQEIGIRNIFISDANFGMYEEDVEVIEYFKQKNLQENAKFNIYNGSPSKLNKDNNLKIFHKIIQGKLSDHIDIPVQSTDKEVLKNADRPAIDWDVNVEMVNGIRKDYPDLDLVFKTQLIYGLPGQTVESWHKTLYDVTKEDFLLINFINEPLPNSPAMNNPEYQSKFQYEYILSNRLMPGRFTSLIPKKSSSFDQSDIVKMCLLSVIHASLAIINFIFMKTRIGKIDISNIVDNFLKTPNYQNFYNNLYHNWTVDNNYYFTIDFDNNKVEIPDISLPYNLLNNTSFLRFIATFLPLNIQHQFYAMRNQSIFQKMVAELVYTEASMCTDRG